MSITKNVTRQLKIRKNHFNKFMFKNILNTMKNFFCFFVFSYTRRDWLLYVCNR